MTLIHLFVLAAIGIDLYAAMVLGGAAWGKPHVGLLGWAAFMSLCSLAVAIIVGYLFFVGHAISADEAQVVRLTILGLVTLPAGVLGLAYHLGRLG